MLEKIALSISTAIFFVCSFIVNSIFPSQPADAVPAEPAIAVSASVSNTATPSLVGKWSGGGKVIEFTADGRILCDGIVAEYRFDGEHLTVNADIGGREQEYRTEIEIIDTRNIKLDTLTLRKTQ